MKVLILLKARKELEEFHKEVQNKFYSNFNFLIDGIMLDRSKFKKLKGTYLYEFRVKYNGNIYRGISKYKESDLIVLLFFQKKSQEIPERYLQTSLNRYNNYIKE